MAVKKQQNRLEEGKLAGLETVLQYQFRDKTLLFLALTHRSEVFDTASNGQPRGSSLADAKLDNEQMEFLGDAVLGFLVADVFCQKFPSSREGELTRLRASVVSRKYLGEVGKRLDLGSWLRVGRTVEKTGGRGSMALLSNGMEALIAAIYRDGGMEAARSFVERELLEPVMPELVRSLAEGSKFNGAVGDFKSALQEKVQGQGLGQPEYRLVEESGPAHKLFFRVSVWADGKELGQGEGASKKEAQQEAARLAMITMQPAVRAESGRSRE